MDQKRKKMDYLSEVIEGEIAKGKLGGASAYVEQNGKILINKNYGTFQKDSIYRIFSMSKPIASVAAYILYERGILDIANPLKEYLPYFAKEKMTVMNEQGERVPLKKEILVSNLLNMTSGIVYPGNDDLPSKIMMENLTPLTKRRNAGEGVTKEEVGKAIAGAPLAFEPGEGWRYGASADIIGLVIEAVTGQKLSEFYQNELFTPLEMKNTRFYVKKENRERIAPFYQYDDRKEQLILMTKEREAELFLIPDGKKPEFEAAGSGLYTTMEDYIHFMQMLLHKGKWNGNRILSEKTIEFLSTNQLSEKQFRMLDLESIKGYGYGNFMRVLLNPVKAMTNGNIGEYGWDGLPGCYMMVDPKEQLIFLYMQQIADGADLSLRRRMRQVIYGNL